MRKKYNYFDDDEPIIQGKNEKSKLKNTVAFFKYIFVVAVFTLRDFSKSLMSRSGRAKIKATAAEMHQKAPAHQGVRMAIAFLLVICLIVSSFLISAKTRSKKEQRFNEEAYKICTQYSNTYGVCNYKSLSSEYSVQGYILTGLCYVREMDFNADDESELLLIYNSNDRFYAEVWGFYKKEFVKLYGNDLYHSGNYNDDVWLALYSDSKKYYIAQHDSDDISRVSLLKMGGDKFGQWKSAEYDAVSQIYSLNGKQEPNNFEQIKVSALKSYNASMITDEVYNTVDGFSSKSDAPIESATKKKSNGINDAYLSIIERYNKQYGTARVLSDGSMAYIDGLAGVELIDFNGDGTNELVLIFRKSIKTRGEDKNGNMITFNEPEYFCEIYGWNKSNATLIYQSEGLSNKLNSTSSRYFITKISGKKRLLCSNRFSVEDYGRTVNAVSRIMKLEDGSFVTDMKAEYQTRYGYTEYYIDGKYQYKSSFEYNGGFSVPFFNGNDDEIDTAVWDVIYVQLPGSEKAQLENQVKQTVKNIQKINPNYSPTGNAVK